MKFQYQFLTLLPFLTTLTQKCESAKILVYIPLPYYSHQATHIPFLKALAHRGHQITFLTAYPIEKHENITQIDLSDVHKVLEEKHFFEVLTSGEQNLKNVKFVFNLTIDLLDLNFRQPQVAKLISGSERFDLVITEFYMPVGAAFAYKFNCPLIGIMSMDGTIYNHQLMGNPIHPLLYPDFNIRFTGKFNFKQRCISALNHILTKIIIAYLYTIIDVKIKNHFGEDMPELCELEKRTNMLFINVNPLFHTVRPLNPETINVGGGYHIEKPKALPKDLQLFLDQSPEGVIYFSLGSSIRSSRLLPKTKSVIVETFAQLPYKVLWKLENAENETLVLPKNVFTHKWFPQQDLLRHPNLKLFINQAGLQSLEEALFSMVPVLVLPFYGDQILNSKKVVAHGLGLSLDHSTLEVESFKAAILDTIQSTKYKATARRLANQLLDKPMSGLDQAVWWTEYILRNPHAKPLKRSQIDIPFYQYYLLDIIVVCLSVLLVLAYLLWIVFKRVVIMFGRKWKIKKE